MALTKTTSVSTVDAWQLVSPATLVTGADANVSASYESLLYIQLAMGEATAQTGCSVFVEVSYTGNDWVKLTGFLGTTETPAATTINDAAVDAGDTSLTLTDATTGDFDEKGRLWFILDETVGNSEAVRTKSNSMHTVTLCDALLRAHANGLTCIDRCDEWVVSIPFPVSYCRVVVNNTDADADVYFTSRLSVVTAIA